MPATQRQPEAGNRKKFGKNPLHTTTTKPTTNERVGKSSERNGLLLLSTKKSPNAGGLLSSKSAVSNKPLPNLNLQNQSTPSTHQVLLSAVVGASQVGSEMHAQPDAWGVADKQHVSVSLETAQMEENNKPEDKPSPEEHHYYHDGARDGAGTANSPRYEMEASWDEYGGRGVQSGKIDEQYSHMSKRAKERGAARREEEDWRLAEQRDKAAQRLKELDEKSGRGRNGGERKLWEPEGEKNVQEHNFQTSESSEGAKEVLIHLSSYEDRDRGTRNGSSAPRMLFDPKSGSMVEVKSRDESANAKRKERKPRHRNRDAKVETPTENRKNPRKLKGRKDSMSSEKSDSEKKPRASARLPRTCGVLYARNEHGTFVCKDECDGDLGYGCHSVPGGRVRNAEGYQKFVDEHAEIFQKHKEMMEGYEVGTGNEPSESSGLMLDTGFNLEEPPQPLEWVKADDKIELAMGVEDSPTLKPTAPEWAPSQAALAAAAAAAAAAAKDYIATDTSAEESGEDAGEEVEEELDDEDEVHSGLGFSMDFMSSPSHLPNPEDAIASVDLKALALEPSAFSSGESSNKNNIFAFGSTTWGTSGATSDQGVLGWGSTGGAENGTGGGLFGSDMFRSTNDEKPSAFLSMPTTTTWGTSPIPGLNLDSTDG